VLNASKIAGLTKLKGSFLLNSRTSVVKCSYLWSGAVIVTTSSDLARFSKSFCVKHVGNLLMYSFAAKNQAKTTHLISCAEMYEMDI
jgi:hypothetical protein